MPTLGRYCVFGNLFAQMGIGSNGNIYRLDRHPSMSKHPVTPADESDLTVHLSKQTNKRIGLLNVVDLLGEKDSVKAAIDRLCENGCEAILFDALNERHFETFAEQMEQLASESERSVFSVGSSGVEMALGGFWKKSGIFSSVAEFGVPAKANPLLVISGSCSPVTTAQIDWAKSNGFEEVKLDAVAICDGDVVDAALLDCIIGKLKQQKNLIVHTGEKKTQNLSSERLGTALGTIAREAVEQSGVKRVLVAGGDTSSYAARAMEIDAVEMIAKVVSGAPLCRTYSKNKWIDGLEVNFKGGQVGAEDYFGKLG